MPFADIARALGNFGNDAATGKSIADQVAQQRVQFAQQQAQAKLRDVMTGLQIQELKNRVQQMNQPQFEGVTKTSGGGEGAIVRDPIQGEITIKDILPGMTMSQVNSRISQMIKGAPTQKGRDILQSINQRTNDPNADPAQILKDAETNYEKFIETTKPQKKDDVNLTKGTVTKYDEDGNAEDIPIFVNGKINPVLMDRERTLVQSAITANQNKFDQQRQLQNERMEAYARTYAQMRGQTQQYSVIDTSTGEPTMVNANTINQNPGRFVAGGIGQQLKNREGVFQEIQYTSKQFENALGKMTDEDFKTLPRLQIAMALQSRDPNSSMSQFIGSEVGGTLTPAQIDYVTGLTSLAESALSLRSIAGMGQGSDTLRHAITSMLPGPATPSKAYARRQMSLFNGEVDALHKPIPDSIRKTMQGDSGSSTSGNSTRILSESAIQRAAKDHGISVEEAEKQAKSAGYTIQ